MKLSLPTGNLVPPPFIPKTSIRQEHIQRVIMDEKFGDISFAVGGIAAEEESEKVANTLTPMFPCSSGYILRECSIGILAVIIC